MQPRALLIALIVVVAGCSAVRPPDLPSGRAPEPPSKPEFRTGLASWYGSAHHGKRTASGEVYDMNAMTTAHRRLPLGTWLFVENPKNGRHVKVRVNDRGPLVDGRVLDLSYAAAQALGVTGAGVFRVRYRVIDPSASSDGVSSDGGARPRQ
jgi:rare lipoprotein A